MAHPTGESEINKSETEMTDSVPGQTPVAFFVFRRPRHTRVTFAAIRAYRPAQLFLIADGPRADHPEDIENCAEVRRIIAEVDWRCKINHNFSDVNLGCGRRVSSGLDWVFSKVDRAMILEDDCLASPEFFFFCDELLERYRDDNSVWAVSGNSRQTQFQRGDGSYFFTRYPDTWGWATWRRSWQHYQHDLPFLEEWKKSPQWKERFPSKSEGRYFLQIFDDALSGAVDTWDYQWVGCVIHAGGLSATPNADLVKNIGLDMEGTHTKTPSEGYDYEITSLGKMVHPSKIEPNAEAEEYDRLNLHRRRSLTVRLLDRARRFLQTR
jgi:hypothetical protein